MGKKRTLSHTHELPRTGWPPPPLAQDDDKRLFEWFASKPDARRLVREAVERIKAKGEAT